MFPLNLELVYSPCLGLFAHRSAQFSCAQLLQCHWCLVINTFRGSIHVALLLIAPASTLVAPALLEPAFESCASGFCSDVCASLTLILLHEKARAIRTVGRHLFEKSRLDPLIQGWVRWFRHLPYAVLRGGGHVFLPLPCRDTLHNAVPC